MATQGRQEGRAWFLLQLSSSFPSLCPLYCPFVFPHCQPVQVQPQRPLIYYSIKKPVTESQFVCAEQVCKLSRTSVSNRRGAIAGKAECSRAALASPSIMWPIPALCGSSRITQNNLAWPIRVGEALVEIRDPTRHRDKASNRKCFTQNYGRSPGNSQSSGAVAEVMTYTVNTS